MEARKEKLRHVAFNPPAPRHNLTVMSFLFLVAAGVAVMVYQRSHAGARAHLQEPFPSKLSAWRLFVGRTAELHPNRGVVPYDINTPLFSDYALKYRFVWLPPEPRPDIGRTTSLTSPWARSFRRHSPFT